LFLLVFGHTYLRVEAMVFGEPSPTLHKTITISQSIDSNWNCTGPYSTPSDFELIYVSSNSQATSTETLVDLEVTGNPEARAPVQEAMDLAAASIGSVDLVVVATIPRTMDLLEVTGVSIILGESATDVVGAPTMSSPATTSNFKIPPLHGFESQMAGTISNLSPLAKLPTTPVGSTQSAKVKSPVAIGVGSVIGGVVFLVSAIVLSLLLVRQCHIRKRRHHPENFSRDMMVVKRTETDFGAKYPAGERGLEEFEDTSGYYEAHSIPSATPIQEDYERDQLDDRVSLSTSASYCSNPGKQFLAVSGIPGLGVVSSEDSNFSKPPLVPLPFNPPPSPAHLKAPSRARTDQQMKIELKIMELQSRYITVGGAREERNRARADLQERIEKIKGLRESEWAYGGKGEVPESLIN
ncbi:hypothetical protein PQX77_018789, partial [Marasmius sp. AFHP31]